VLPSRVSRSLDGEHALGVKLKKANRVRASTSQRAWIKGALNDAGSVPTSKGVSNYFARMRRSSAPTGDLIFCISRDADTAEDCPVAIFACHFVAR
jgi:hypothetical protein